MWLKRSSIKFIDNSWNPTLFICYTFKRQSVIPREQLLGKVETARKWDKRKKEELKSQYSSDRDKYSNSKILYLWRFLTSRSQFLYMLTILIPILKAPFTSRLRQNYNLPWQYVFYNVSNVFCNWRGISFGNI